MARHNRRRDEEPQRSAPPTAQNVESYDGEDWVVRRLSGASSSKSYRCPGCQQLVPAGVAHVVSWPMAAVDGAELRRHWHTPCWAARDRRRPTAR